MLSTLIASGLNPWAIVVAVLAVAVVIVSLIIVDVKCAELQAAREQIIDLQETVLEQEGMIAALKGDIASWERCFDRAHRATPEPAEAAPVEAVPCSCGGSLQARLDAYFEEIDDVPIFDPYLRRDSQALKLIAQR